MITIEIKDFSQDYIVKDDGQSVGELVRTGPTRSYLTYVSTRVSKLDKFIGKRFTSTLAASVVLNK